MIRPLVIGTAIATLCAASQITAQAMLSDSSARMERVAEGVFAIVHRLSLRARHRLPRRWVTCT